MFVLVDGATMHVVEKTASTRQQNKVVHDYFHPKPARDDDDSDQGSDGGENSDGPDSTSLTPSDEEMFDDGSKDFLVGDQPTSGSHQQVNVSRVCCLPVLSTLTSCVSAEQNNALAENILCAFTGVDSVLHPRPSSAPNNPCQVLAPVEGSGTCFDVYVPMLDMGLSCKAPLKAVAMDQKRLNIVSLLVRDPQTTTLENLLTGVMESCTCCLQKIVPEIKGLGSFCDVSNRLKDVYDVMSSRKLCFEPPKEMLYYQNEPPADTPPSLWCNWYWVRCTGAVLSPLIATSRFISRFKAAFCMESASKSYNVEPENNDVLITDHAAEVPPSNWATGVSVEIFVPSDTDTISEFIQAAAKESKRLTNPRSFVSNWELN